MNNIDFEEVFWASLFVMLIACIVLFAYFAYLGAEHSNYMQGYVGRQFIFRKDTVTVMDYDIGKEKFILSNSVVINERIIYKLKEVPCE